MKRRKPTSKHVPAKGILREKCDKLWGKAVLADWNWTCAVCSKRATDPHHLIPRQHFATRYDLRNGIALCTPDHVWNNDTAPHQNAAGWLMWLESRCPKTFEWYMHTMESGAHKVFNGTKDATFFCGRIRELKQYVNESDYQRIVGVRFSEWLDKEDTA